MIRIDLLQRRQLRLQTRLTGIVGGVLVVGLVLVGLHWVNQRYPFYRLIRGPETKVVETDAGRVEMRVDEVGEAPEEVGVPEVVSEEAGVWEDVPEEAGVWEDAPEEAGIPEAIPEETVVREDVPEVAGVPEDASEQVAVPEEVPEEVAEPVLAVPATAVPEPSASADAGRQLPQWSSACAQALRLYERIPSSIHFTGLTSNASGEYTLEGLSPSSEAAMEVFLDTLRRRSRVSLSLWRGGKMQTKRLYKFTFQGQLTEFDTAPLEPLSAPEARALFRQVVVWGRQSGLDSVVVEAPIQVRLRPALVQHRQKMWAVGSYREIRLFVERLKQVQGRATLEELVVIPIYQRDEHWQKAHFYTVVDVLAQTAEGRP